MTSSLKCALWSGGLALATLLLVPPWKNPGGYTNDPVHPTFVGERCFAPIYAPPPPFFTIDGVRLCLIATALAVLTSAAIVTLGMTRDHNRNVHISRKRRHPLAAHGSWESHSDKKECKPNGARNADVPCHPWFLWSMNTKQKIALWLGTIIVTTMLLCPPWVTAVFPLYTELPHAGAPPAVKLGYVYRPVFGDYDCGFLVDRSRLAIQVAVMVVLTAVAVVILGRYRPKTMTANNQASDNADG